MDNVRIVQVKHEPPDDYETQMPENQSEDLMPDDSVSRNETSSPSVESVHSDVPKKKRRVKCDQCNKVYPDKYSLKKHVLTHSTSYPYKCLHCDLSFKIKQYLNKHYTRVHEKKRDHTCKICRKSFYSRNSLSVHSMIHTGERPFKCEICDKGFNRNYTLNLHILIHTGEKPYKCGFCDYSCRDNSTLRKHETRHMGISIAYHCKKCKYRCKAKWMLKQHVLEKHYCMDVRIFKCTQCRAKFKHKAVLKQHIKTVHENIQQFQCDVCKKYISRRSNLLAHINSHFGERVFKCDFGACSKIFKSKADLQKHKIIHFPDNHTECPHCGRRFARLQRLRKHVKVMHGTRKKDTPCDICGVSFYSQSYLAQHMRVVHGTTVMCECDYCGDTYRNKPGLIMHMKYAHQVKYEIDPCPKDIKTTEPRTEKKSENEFKCDSEIKQEIEVSFETQVDISEIKEELLEATDKSNEDDVEDDVGDDVGDDEGDEVDVETFLNDQVINTVKIGCQDMNQLTYSHDIMSEDIAKCIIANDRDVKSGPERLINRYYVEHAIGNIEYKAARTSSARHTNVQMREVLQKVQRKMNAKKDALKQTLYYMANKQILETEKKRKKCKWSLCKRRNTVINDIKKNDLCVNYNGAEGSTENPLDYDVEKSTKLALEKWKDKIDLNKELIIKLEDIAKLEGFKMEQNENVDTSPTKTNTPAQEDLKEIEDLLAVKSVTSIENDEYILKMWHMNKEAKLEGRQISFPCNQCPKVCAVHHTLRLHIKFMHEKYKQTKKRHVAPVKPYTVKPYTVKPYTVKPYTVTPYTVTPYTVTPYTVRLTRQQETVDNVYIKHTESPENMEIEDNEPKGLRKIIFQCHLCKRICSTKQALRKHIHTHGSFPCNQCTKVCDTLRNLSLHTTFHNKFKRKEQQVASVTLKRVVDGQETVSNVSASNTSMAIAKPMDRKHCSYPCNQCTKVCTTLRNLTLHITHFHDKFKRKEQQDAPVTLERQLFEAKVVNSQETVVNVSASNTDSLENVEIEKNATSMATAERKIMFPCHLCKRKCSTAHGLKLHISSHGSFPCNQCTTVCISRHHLTLHVAHFHRFKTKQQMPLVTAKRQVFVAKVVDSQETVVNVSASNTNSLENMEIEKNATSMATAEPKGGKQRIFPCHICKKICSTSYCLKQHIESHGSFPCNQCTTVCTTLSHLRLHKTRCHRFTRKDQMPLVTLNRQLSASDTSMAIAKPINRKIRSYPCNQCTKVCASVWHLKMHIKHSHDKFKRKKQQVASVTRNTPKRQVFVAKVVDSQETVVNVSASNTNSLENVEIGKNATSMATAQPMDRRICTYPCNQCTKVCSTLRNLRLHITHAHDKLKRKEQQVASVILEKQLLDNNCLIDAKVVSCQETVVNVSVTNAGLLANVEINGNATSMATAEPEDRNICFPCNQCTKAFASLRNLKIHTTHVHKLNMTKQQEVTNSTNSANSANSTNSTNSTIRATYISDEYISKMYQIAIQAKLDSQNITFPCNQCSNVYMSFSTLKSHIDTFHKPVKKKTNLKYIHKKKLNALKIKEIVENAACTNPILEDSEEVVGNDSVLNTASRRNEEIVGTATSINTTLGDGKEILENGSVFNTYSSTVPPQNVEMEEDGVIFLNNILSCTEEFVDVDSVSSIASQENVQIEGNATSNLLKDNEVLKNASVNNTASSEKVEIEENTTFASSISRDSEEIVENASVNSTALPEHFEIKENAICCNPILGDSKRIVENTSEINIVPMEVDDDMGRLILEDDEEIEDNAPLSNITPLQGMAFNPCYYKSVVLDKNHRIVNYTNQDLPKIINNLEIDHNVDKSDRVDKIDWNIHKTDNTGKCFDNNIQPNKPNEEIVVIRRVPTPGINVGYEPNKKYNMQYEAIVKGKIENISLKRTPEFCPYVKRKKEES